MIGREQYKRAELLVNLSSLPAKQWNGRLFGTNTGNVSVFLDVVGGELGGELRFLDDVFGPCVYQLRGTWEGDVLKLHGRPVQGPDGVALGEIEASAQMVDGILGGRWFSALGTGGSFSLSPHAYVERSDRQPSGSPGGAPDQLHTTQIRLGTIRLYRPDVTRLVALILDDFQSHRLAITYQRDRGPAQASEWSNDFLARTDFKRAGYFKLTASETRPSGANRSVIVELGYLFNEINVTGEDQVWVTGKAETLRAFLASRQSNLVTQFKVWNVSLVQIALMGLVVWMIGMPSLGNRAILAAATLAAIMTVNIVHLKLLPNAGVSLEDRPPPLTRFLPSIVSWLAALLSAVVVAVLAHELES